MCVCARAQSIEWMNRGCRQGLRVRMWLGGGTGCVSAGAEMVGQGCACRGSNFLSASFALQSQFLSHQNPSSSHTYRKLRHILLEMIYL